ncbi:MAG: hypothetical protein Q4E50_06400 [Tissierellia bacterium]|nr:hypothetical protein [Tissierellia bacterium]
MGKVLIIAGKQVKFKATGGFLIKFRNLTGQDPIKAISNLEITMGEINFRSKNKNSHLDKVNFEQLILFYQIVWVLAKTADREIGDLEDWIDSFDEFPIADILVDLVDLIQQAFKTNLTLRETKKTNKFYN